MSTYLNEQTVIVSLGEMLLSRVVFGSVGNNCVMDFGNRWMCFLAGITDGRLWMLVQTVRRKRSSVVGFSGASPEGVVRLRGCVEMSVGAEESAGAEDWGYIRLVAVVEPPFCV